MELANSLFEALPPPDSKQLAVFLGIMAVAIYLTREDK